MSASLFYTLVAVSCYEILAKDYLLAKDYSSFDSWGFFFGLSGEFAFGFLVSLEIHSVFCLI